MAKKIEVVISAKEEASAKVKDFNKALTNTQKIADATASSYDRMSALSNRLQLNTLRLADAQRRLSTETDPHKQTQLRVEIDNLTKSQDDLQREIHESSDSISDMGSRSKDVKVLGLSLTDLLSGINLVTGAAQTLYQVGKAAFDFTEEGASIVQTRKSFERLGVSIEAMREVSLGTIDDMTLMKSTLTLTAGASEVLQAKLLENAPALLRIAKAANAVNPGLGTTAQMYESISTGIKRASPLILDNLGIVVKIDTANREYAKTLGITVEEMTAADKQMALLNATIEAGDRLIEQAGGSVESYGDAWAQLRVELKNATDAAKAHAAEAMGPLIKNYIEFLKLRTESGRFLIGLGEQFRGLNYVLAGNERVMDRIQITWKLASLQWADARDLTQELADEIAGVTVKEEQSGEAARGATDKLRRLNDERQRELDLLERMAGNLANTHTLTSHMSTLVEKNALEVYYSTLAWNQYSDALERNEEMLSNVAVAQIAAREAQERAREVRLIQNQNTAMEISAAIRSDLTDRLEEGASTLADLRQKQADVNLEIEKLTASHGRAIITQREATLTDAEAALATLQLADAQKRLSEETDPLKQAQLVVRIENLSEKLGGASEATTTFVNNTKKIDELKGKYSELAGEIDGVRDAIAETIQGFMLQQMEAVFAVGGWTDAEVKVFTDTAVAFGFMDEQHANLIQKIREEGELIDEVGETREQAMLDSMGVTQRLIGVQKNVAWEYSRIESDGIGALRNLEEPTQRESLLMRELAEEAQVGADVIIDMGITSPIELQKIEKAAGHAVEQLINIGDEATVAQEAIDKMHGKTIDIHFNVTESFSRVSVFTEEDIGMEAEGGDYIVNKPTPFIAGDAGPERAIFIPKGKPGFDMVLPDGKAPSPSPSHNILSNPIGQIGQIGPIVPPPSSGKSTVINELNIYVSGTADAQETARLVMQEFQGRGLMPQIPLR